MIRPIGEARHAWQGSGGMRIRDRVVIEMSSCGFFGFRQIVETLGQRDALTVAMKDARKVLTSDAKFLGRVGQGNPC